MSLVTLAHCLLCFCVVMCLVIRFPLLFKNVCACTLGAYFYAKIAVGECPWLLPWFHQFWWNGGLVLRPGRGMKPPNMTRGFWSFSAVLIGGFQPRTKPPFIPDTFNHSVLIRRFRNHWMKPPMVSCSCQVHSAVGGRRIETPMFPCLSRDSFGGHILRPGRRMKPPICMFQGQCCLFTRQFCGLYKYIFFSCSYYHSENQEPYFHKREKTF